MIAFWDTVPRSLVEVLHWDYTALYPRKLSLSYLLPWEPKISHTLSLSFRVFWIVAPCSQVVALMMEVVCTSETSVHFIVTTQRYNPEDPNFILTAVRIRNLTFTVFCLDNLCRGETPNMGPRFRNSHVFNVRCSEAR
jgi:hypothetical protein